jgi:beclin 1
VLTYHLVAPPPVYPQRSAPVCVAAAPSLSGRMLLSPASFRSTPRSVRPASGRSSTEIRCQNPDCAAVLEVSSIPVEYESECTGARARASQREREEEDLNPPRISTYPPFPSSPDPRAPPAAILRQLLEVAADDASPHTPAAAPAPGGAAARSSADDGSLAPPSPPTPPSPLTLVAAKLDAALPAFREAAKRGDSVSFAVLVAELCSGAAGVELPLCDACVSDCLRARGRSHGATAVRRDAALEAKAVLEVTVRSLVQGSGAGAGTPASALGEQLAAREAALVADIRRQRERLARAKAARAALAAKAAQLAALEQGLWSEGRELNRSLTAGKERLYAMRLRAERGRVLLGKLRRLSVHADAFFLWHRGPFVTINGARLGRLPGMPVEWPEINAALGQMAFLLSTVAARTGYLFGRFRVIPMGSFSKIAPAGDERAAAAFELFYDNSFFATSRLNNGLKALAACVAELGAFAESADRSFRLPYAISPSGDKVADLPTTFGKDVQWTRAMKLVATNLKWLVAWSFRQQGGSGSGGGGGGM